MVARAGRAAPPLPKASAACAPPPSWRRRFVPWCLLALCEQLLQPIMRPPILGFKHLLLSLHMRCGNRLPPMQHTTPLL